MRQFQQLMQTALLAGALAGTLLFFYQQVVVVPRIVAAEAYEARDEGTGAEVDQHQHSERKPNNGLQRSFFTAAGTILTGIGFAALLLSVVSLGGFALDVRRGLLWGLAGFVCFAVAPGLGLPPVPPGVPVADVRARQLWWVMTVVTTAIGLFLIFATRRGWISRTAGGLFLLLPHAIGAPQTIGPQIVPAHLVRAFAVASIVGNGLFWLVLGAATGFLFSRFDGTFTRHNRQNVYRMNMAAYFSTVWYDLRFGMRVLRRSRGITAVAILSLALGIGATTSIFSVVYGVLISPYPYSRPREIWAPSIRDARNPKQGRATYKAAEVLRMRELPALSMVMSTAPENRILKGDRAAENFTSIQLTANAFQFLAVDPILGRTIVPSDIRPDGQPEPVIVLSYKAWQRLFEGREDAIGKAVVLNDIPYTVIGVMPSRFGWWTSDGGWLPMALDPRSTNGMFPIVRLAAGVSSRAAREQLQSFHQQLAQARPADFPRDGFVTELRNYLDITVASGEMQSSLRLLFGAVGFLLLIACANVANLQLARATSRAREIALRMSVGAGRSRVLRQLLTESVTLSLAGGIPGIFLAVAMTRAVVALMPEFYVPNEARITVNAYVLTFSAAVSILTGILFGLAPAIECSRLDLVETLKDGGKGGGAGSAGGRTRNLLVIAEVALSVVLLVGASLTVRGFVSLQSTELGFQPDRVLMIDVQLPAKRYSTWEQRVAFAEGLLERAKAIPGAQTAALGNGGLPFGGPRSPYTLQGELQAGRNPILVNLISSDYARTLGIPLLSGSALTAQEVTRAERVALINQAAAKLWPDGQSPVGKRIHLNVLERPPGSVLLPPNSPAADVTVVGILGNTRNDGLRNPTAPAVFLPYTLVAPTGRTLAVRAHNGNPMALLNAVREQVRQLDKELPLGRPITMAEVLGDETKQPRFNMALFSFFGGLGLSLAAIGIFSVLSYSVVLRTHEIGVRMALGAERSHVLTLVVSLGAKLLLAGLAIGLGGSLLLARYLKSEVFQAPATDPVSLIGVVLLLGIAAFFACLVPALRAARLDPMHALKHD